MQNIALGKDSLIRSLPTETRVLHRQNSLREYKIATNRKLTGKQIVLMVQWIENGYWKNKSVVAQPFYEVGRLSNSSIFKKNQTEAVHFCTAKGHRMLTPNLRLGELFEKYHDTDDQMLYLKLIRQNSFGGI